MSIPPSGKITVKTISLSRGKVALIDDEDLEKVTQHNWNLERARKGLCYYAVSALNGRKLCMHRLIIEAPDGKDVHHINHNGLDNRKANLLICTRTDNVRNKRPSQHSSKYKGVSWCKRVSRWQAKIQLEEKHYHLGYFNSEMRAAKVYDRNAKVLLGPFAYLNFGEDKEVKT